MPSWRPLFQTCALVFFSSLSVLGLEVALVRICSIRYSYHYATLIISLSMIGFVVGGAVAFLTQKAISARYLPAPSRPRTLLPFLAGLVLTIPLAAASPRFVPFDPYRLLWDNGQTLYLMVLACVLAVPFFVYGTMMPLLFRAEPALAGPIYAGDLSGAAAGVLGAVLLADALPPEGAIMVLAVLPAIAAGTISRKRGLVLSALSLYLLGIYGLISFGPYRLPMSSYAGLPQALREEGSSLKGTIHTAHSRIDLFENQRMRFAPGLSLSYAKPVPKGLGIAVDGTVAGVILSEGALGSYDFFNHMASALPYLLTSSPRVVVSGGKGGTETLMAHYLGARHVVWTDNDLSMKRLIHGRFGETGLYGGAFRHESARAYLHQARDIDLVVISRTAFTPSGTFGLQEDYETTVEALQTCLGSLAKDGLLYVQLFVLPPPRYELRLTGNLVQALKGMGAANAADHLLVFRSWDTMNFLIKKSGFTADNRAVARRFIEEMGFAMLWPKPRTSSAGIVGVDYGAILERVIDEKGRGVLEESYPFDVRTTTDDRPFFHYFLKAGRIGEIYRLSGRKWAYFVYEGMALPFLGGFLLLMAVLVFTGVFLYSRLGGKKLRPPTVRESPRPPVHRPFRRLGRYVFFILIGTGFMFVEVFFIHTLILPLGSPVRAFASTLVVLLVGCGAGSLTSRNLGPKGASLYILLGPLLLSVSVLCLPLVRASFFLIFLVLLCGVPLGVFFPSGLRLLCKSEETAIPLAYALNGAASIVAPPLASLIASATGLRALLVWSLGIYLTASLIFVLLLLSSRGLRMVTPVPVNRGSGKGGKQDG